MVPGIGHPGFCIDRIGIGDHSDIGAARYEVANRVAAEDNALLGEPGAGKYGIEAQQGLHGDLVEDWPVG